MKKFYVLLIALLLGSGVMAQWFPQNSGTTRNLYDVYFTNANTGYTVGDSTILKTIDDGATWDTLSGGNYFYLNAVHFPAFNTGYIVGWGYNNSSRPQGIILKTDDSGITWSASFISLPDTDIVISDVFFPDNSNGYLAGQKSSGPIPTQPSWLFINKTNDSGLTWNYAFEGEPFLHPNSIYFTNNNTGYLVGFVGHNYGVGGTIGKTTDGGVSWEWIMNNFPGLFSIFFTDANNGYIVGYGGKILKTIDGGTNWISQNSGTSSLLNAVFFPTDDIGYIVGNNGTILKTIDGGTNWMQLSSGTSNQLHSVFFTSADTGYVVGYSGTILKTINGGGNPVGINDINQTINTLTIYPNPTYTQITISTPTTPDKNTTLTIIDISGQVILTRQITEQQTVVDVSGLSQGVYVVRVADDRTVMVGKFVKN